MNPQAESPLERDAAREHAHLEARRRLLRGSFGVPAVLTLTSGSALAASSPIRCFNNAPDNASDSDRTNFSVPQYKVDITGSSGTVSVAVVKVTELKAIETSGLGLIVVPSFAEAWVRVDSFTAINVGTGVPMADGVLVAPRFTRTGGTDANPIFTVTGLVPLGSTGSTAGGNTGKIISQSCWSSFKPAPSGG